MKVIRSWPAEIPDGRCYVVDTLPRLVMTGYDYRCLAYVDDDVVLIEWDMAVHREELQTFIDRAVSAPGDVLVAPYRIYESTIKSVPLNHPVWPLRRYTDDGTRMRWVEEGEPFCHLFAFGLTYLPRSIVAAYLKAQPDEHFNDVSFSGWHHRNVRAETPIAWDVRPVHLHYAIDRM